VGCRGSKIWLECENFSRASLLLLFVSSLLLLFVSSLLLLFVSSLLLLFVSSLLLLFVSSLLLLFVSSLLLLFVSSLLLLFVSSLLLLFVSSLLLLFVSSLLLLFVSSYTNLWPPPPCDSLSLQSAKGWDESQGDIGAKTNFAAGYGGKYGVQDVKDKVCSDHCLVVQFTRRTLA
jgi:hypothetical protein